MKEADLDVIKRKTRECQIPIGAIFELTYCCNLKCVHCLIPESYRNAEGELTTKEVFNVIDQLADAGTLDIAFTGGEPLVRKDFLAIAEYARKRNMALSLISNGTLIDENFVQTFKRLYFQNIAISVYGITPQTHESVTVIPGSFHRTMNAVQILTANGLKVNIKTTVMKQNLQELPKIFEWCQKKNLGFEAFPLIEVSLDGSTENIRWRLNDEEMKDYLRWESETLEYLPALDRKCNAGLNMVSISPYGEVYPCVALKIPAGNLRKEKFEQIWRCAPILVKLRNMKFTDFQECPECPLLDLCSRCPGFSLPEEGDFLVPSREECRIARLRKEVRNEKGTISKARTYQA